MEASLLHPESVPGNSLWYLNVSGNIPGDNIDPDPPELSIPGAGITKNSLNLTWTASTSEDIYSYKVFRSTSGKFLGEEVQIAFVPALTPPPYTFTDTGLTSNTKYYYRVSAIDTSFNDAVSNIASKTTISSPVTFTLVVSIPPFINGPVYINREITPAQMPGNVNWTAIKLPCDYSTYQCTKTLTLQENTKFNFLFSRGSIKTVQTMADGNSVPIDPSFTVEAEMKTKTVKRVIYNWDDPIVIDFSPKGTKVIPYKTVTITWNQSMPSNTTFSVFDIGSAGTSARTPVAGTYLYDAENNSVTFTANAFLKTMCHYQVEVLDKLDSKTPAIAQQTVTRWNFMTDKWRSFSPMIFKQ